MKNQYFADVGDFGKYGLLRYLISNGITVGINWYLTENDLPEKKNKQNDGKYIKYLEREKASEYRVCDEELYDFLKETNPQKAENRNVKKIEESRILGDTIFYSDYLAAWMELSVGERSGRRQEWHTNAVEALKSRQLVFLDPDNGFKERSSKRLGRESVKHTYTDEIVDYYNNQDVCVYCHRGRRSLKLWNEKIRELNEKVGEANIRELVFRRGTERSYIFLCHPEHTKCLNELLNAFVMGEWERHFYSRYNSSL